MIRKLNRAKNQRINRECRRHHHLFFAEIRRLKVARAAMQRPNQHPYSQSDIVVAERTPRQIPTSHKIVSRIIAKRLFHQSRKTNAVTVIPMPMKKALPLAISMTTGFMDS